ncbi:uncharacterized protein LOC134755020 [Cydia strobilella]|uniref:uncharacterized protein LOC134755020 n=1 Tax=Cydia strobilella TaxID=1100964 RepID=UPI0030043A21
MPANIVELNLSGIKDLNVQDLSYCKKEFTNLKTLDVTFTNIFLCDLEEICCDSLKNIGINFFKPNYLIDVDYITWNASITVFDDEFFKGLLLELTDYFPTYVCMRTKTEGRITEAPSNWYCIDSCDTFDGDDFFGDVFLQCKKLHTLDVSIIERDPLCLGNDCTQSLFTNLHETKLKNLRFKSIDIDYENFFTSLSKCPTVEHIHICNLIPKTLNKNHFSLRVCYFDSDINPFADVFNPSPLNITQ